MMVHGHIRFMVKGSRFMVKILFSNVFKCQDGRGTGSWHKERGDGRNDVRWMMAEVCGERGNGLTFPYGCRAKPSLT